MEHTSPNQKSNSYHRNPTFVYGYFAPFETLVIEEGRIGFTFSGGYLPL